MDPREIKLPVWAQDLIDGLRKRLDIARDPLVHEVARLRPLVDRLKARNEALQELLECAARGGHRTAQEIIEVIEGYDFVLTRKGE